LTTIAFHIYYQRNKDVGIIAMSHKFNSVDYKIQCQFYEKDIDVCPSAKIRITDEELETILTKCVTKDHKSCPVFQKLSKEKAA